MSEQLEHAPEQTSIWKQALPNTLGTVIGGGILAALAALYALVSGMDLNDVVLYILVPLAALATVAGFIVTVRAIQQLLRNNVEWRALIEDAVLESHEEVKKLQSEVHDVSGRLAEAEDSAEQLGAAVVNAQRAAQRVALAEVIDEATRQGWTVYDSPDGQGEVGLVFLSPDEDQIPMYLHEIDPADVARQLAANDPHHFDEGWEPAGNQGERVDGLVQTMKELDTSLRQLYELVKTTKYASDEHAESARLDAIVAIIELLRIEGWAAKWNGGAQSVTLKLGKRERTFPMKDVTGVQIFSWARQRPNDGVRVSGR